MKSFFLLLAIITLSTCNPLEGKFYVSWYYNENIDNTQPNPISCMYVEIDTDDEFYLIRIIDGKNYTSYASYSPPDVYEPYWAISDFDPAVPDIPGSDFNFLTSFQQDNLVGFFSNVQAAFGISTTPQMNPTFLNAQIALLKLKHYEINSTNTVTFENNC